MADKLITIDYKTTPANISIPSTLAKVTAQEKTTKITGTITYPTSEATSSSSVLAKVTLQEATTQVPETSLYTTKVPDTIKLNVVVTNAGEESVPTSGKYRRALSILLLSEITSKNILKPVISNTLVTDSFFTSADFNRIFESNLNNYSLLLLQANKNLSNNTALVDSVFAQILVQKSNQIFSIDQIEKFLSLQKFSAFVHSDFSNIVTLKFVPNTVFGSENLQRTVEYARNLFDFADITDDYYGQSNVDDDQTAYFDKRLISVLQGSDLSSRTPVKIITSQIGYTQVSRALIQPQKLEQVLFADLSTRRPRKNNVEVIQKSDLASKLYNKPLNEIRTASDTAPVKSATKSEFEFVGTNTLNFSSVYKNTQQTAVFTEIVYPALTMPREFFNAANVVLLENKLVNITKSDQTANALTHFIDVLAGKTETTELVESLATVSNYNRNFYSYLYATDDYYGQANLDDDQIAAFNKALINIVQRNDVHSIFSETNRFSLLTTNSNLVEKNVGTIISTPYASSDTLSSLTTKLLQDGFTASDITSILSGSFLFSAANVQDNLKEFIFDKILRSASTSTEIISSTPTKALNTVATLVDPKSFYLATTTNSQVASAISLAKTSQVVYENSVGNTSQQAIFASNLNLLTSISSVQDLIDVLSSLTYSVLSQVFSDDTGYANNQNYFSQAYVEPGYVGTNSYFS
jgi:hypothetical protein